MMASKARLFGDDTALSAILASNDPRDQKCLGRQVRHFDHELWQSACESIVLHGNHAKFSQNEEMLLALIQTGNRGLSQPPPFPSHMTLRMPLLQEIRPPPFIIVWMYNTNATADVSPYNGISAILGQHKACAQIAIIMNGRGLSPPLPFGLRSLYTHTSVPLDMAPGAYDAPLT